MFGTEIFDLQRFADSPDDNSNNISWSGKTVINSESSYTNQTYTSTSADENAILIDTSNSVTLTNPTVTKSGGVNASDNYSFYGINSAVMCKGGGATSIIGGSVITSAAGANGIFSYGANSGETNATGDGTKVYIENVTINTSGAGSGGIMTTFGGTTVAKNLTVSTSGQSSAPIRTDRGGGWVTVSGGSYESNGVGSPAIYSTADITVNDAALTSNVSEGVCIEGTGSIELTNCTLTAGNTTTNGNATFKDSVMIYQSFSGDASTGNSTFSMTGGSLISKNGHVFHVTNTHAAINLSNVNITNRDSEGVFISVCDDGWSGSANVATLTASAQLLNGKILVGDNSTLYLNVSNSSTISGAISGVIKNANGKSVSSDIGTVNVTLDSSSKWYLTEDTYISSFSGEAANVIVGNHTLYVNGTALENVNTVDSTDTTPAVSTGLTYNYGRTAVTVDSSYTNTSLTSANYSSNVITINAAQDTNNIAIAGNSNNNVIIAGSGRSTLWGGRGNDTLIGGSARDFFLLTSNSGTNTIRDFKTGTASDSDVINISEELTSMTRSGGSLILKVSDGSTFNVTLSSDVDTVIQYSTDMVNVHSTKIGNSRSGDTFNYDASVEYYLGGGGENTLSVSGGDNFEIWLDNGQFSSIQAINASSTTGSILIAGDSANNKITAGSGSASLWGGTGGNDTLTGGSGRDMFWFTENGGNDVARNFKAGTDSDSDIVNIVGAVSSMTRNNNNLNLAMSDGSSFNITFQDSDVDKAVQYSTDATDILSAKIGNTNSGDTFTYESNVDYYIGNGGENTITISGAGNVEVWLDNDKFSNIKSVNASNATGSVLMAGDSADNRITAGIGSASLWGGNGGNDTLIGGSGTDMFWYGKNNGNDIVQNSAAGDIINLFDINLSDLANAVKSGTNLIITTTDGDNLTVAGNSAATFRLADNSSWQYNHDSNTWNQA